MTNLPEVLKTPEEQAQVLAVLLENNFDSVLITDASSDGGILYVNAAFTTLTGYEPSEVIGKNPRMLQGPGTDRAVIDSLASAIKSGGTFEGRAVNYRKNGEPFIMNWRVVPVRSGNQISSWLAIQREG